MKAFSNLIFGLILGVLISTPALADNFTCDLKVVDQQTASNTAPAHETVVSVYQEQYSCTAYLLNQAQAVEVYLSDESGQRNHAVSEDGPAVAEIDGATCTCGLR